MMLNARHCYGSEAQPTDGGAAGRDSLRKANRSVLHTTIALFYKRFLSHPIITENFPLLSNPNLPLHSIQRVQHIGSCIVKAGLFARENSCLLSTPSPAKRGSELRLQTSA